MTTEEISLINTLITDTLSKKIVKGVKQSVKAVALSADDDQLLTLPEVADLLGINNDAVYALVRSGELQALKLGSRKVRRGTLRKYLAKLENDFVYDEEAAV